MCGLFLVMLGPDPSQTTDNLGLRQATKQGRCVWLLIERDLLYQFIYILIYRPDCLVWILIGHQTTLITNWDREPIFILYAIYFIFEKVET